MTELPREKTAGERTVARTGWVLALVATVGLFTTPFLPWAFLWVPMLTFGTAKVPRDLHDAWVRCRVRREREHAHQ